MWSYCFFEVMPVDEHGGITDRHDLIDLHTRISQDGQEFCSIFDHCSLWQTIPLTPLAPKRIHAKLANGSQSRILRNILGIKCYILPFLVGSQILSFLFFVLTPLRPSRRLLF